MQYSKLYLWIIISVIITNCAETNSQIPGISSIQDLIDVESKSTVSLDGDSFQIIVPDLAIGKSDSKPDDFLARPASIILAKNNILISDSGNNRLVTGNQEGEIVNKTGTDGRGPGEFRNIQELTVNSQYIFLQDIGNQKILVYDHDLSLFETLNVSTFGPVDANNNHLFLYNSNYKDHLVTVHSAEPPFEKKFEFLPVIVPRGKQPSGYNFIKIASNNQSYTLFSYTALPYLILVDKNLDHVHTIELQGSVVSEIVNQNPDTEPVDAGEMTMIRNIISTFAMDDQRNIYLGIGRTLYILENRSNNYTLKNAFQIDASSVSNLYDKPIGFFKLFVTGDGRHLYHASIHHEHVFRIPTGL